MGGAPSDEKSWLERADQRLFLSGTGDLAEQLCQANMRVGLAKILHAEAQLGLLPQACFIGSPDATVTRNRRRWQAGFGYGGLVCWHPSLVVLDAMPNGCGMLVGAPDRPRSEAEVRDSARATRSSPPRLDGIELEYDLGESNHFVDALELEEELAGGAPAARQLFIIHSSGHEHRRPSPLGSGLYLDQSPLLQQQARRLPTPWGPLHLLLGAAANEYHAFYQRVQSFNSRRRQLYGELLFGPHQVIANHTHQGLRAPGELLLGSYAADAPGLYPLTLGPDQPVYLIRPLPSFSSQAMRRLGWASRAEAAGLAERLGRANLLPHGGGYCFPTLERLLGVEQKGERRELRLLPRGGAEPVVVDQVRSLPFGFRGEEVLQRLIELELGVPVARYRIKYVVKD